MFQVSSFKFQDKRRGNVLLLAILLLAGGIVGGLTIAVLVVSEIRQARSLDNALLGYFDAESGLEQSLYEIRQAEACVDNICDDADFNACAGSANCKVKINPSPAVLVPLIKTDDTFQLDIEPIDGLTTIAIDWAPADSDNLPFLEVSFLNIISGQTVVERPNFGVPYSCVYDADTNTCQTIEFSASDFFTDGTGVSQTYQARFKALKNDINNLNVYAVTPADGVFSGYLEVASRSQKTNIRQELKTNVPSQLPVYGFTDYVIFSEQDIVK